MDRTARCLLFDWGDTLMRDFRAYTGKMVDWPRVEAMPGAAEALAVLQAEWTLAVATNAEASTEAEIRQALARARLAGYFDRIYCFNTIGHKKPSKGFFDWILADLGLLADQVVMIGDSYENDVQGALRAGLRAVWYNPQNQNREHTDRLRIIQTLSELPACLHNWHLE